MKRFVPLAVFIALVAMMAWSLTRPSDRYVPSHLVGQPVPSLALAKVVGDRDGIVLPARDGPRLVNIFASWCVPCIAEVPLLAELAQQGVAIDGIALRDKPGDVARFLERYGNPYARIGADPEGRAQIALGASGVPETFIVDGRGIIRYHHVGPVEARDMLRIAEEWEKLQ